MRSIFEDLQERICEECIHYTEACDDGDCPFNDDLDEIFKLCEQAEDITASVISRASDRFEPVY